MNPGIGHIVFKNVAFFGDAEVPPESREYKQAFEVAKYWRLLVLLLLTGVGLA